MAMTDKAGHVFNTSVYPFSYWTSASGFGFQITFFVMSFEFFFLEDRTDPSLERNNKVGPAFA